MANKPLPEKYRRYYNEETVEELWEKYLNEGNIRLRRNRPFHGKIPANPRCVNCLRPFKGIGGVYYRIFQGLQKSDKNPRYCTGCHSFIHEVPGGAEVELTMLFVDVRGSTTIAETMDAFKFSRLMNRFYEAAINVLVSENAFIDKLVGDEVTALFIPGFTGEDHAQKAVDAGRGLLKTTGYGKSKDPWVPIGVGIHTGIAWVGSIVGANGEAADFTALGDNVNIAARLASHAGPGEVIISEATYYAAQMENNELETRDLELKGKSESVRVRVLTTN